MRKIFRGVYAVTITPFLESGGVDEALLREHIRWLIDDGGVHGIIPTGSTGEFAYLDPEERRMVARITIEAVNGQVPVIIGTAACATRDVIELAQDAQSIGAQGVMVLPPYYGHLNQDELFSHFSEVARSIDIPIMLYNNPGTSGSDILPETIARLGMHKNIRAIKESTGMMQRIHELQMISGAEQIEILCGCDTLPLEMFLMGIEGWVAAPSNTIPRACVDLYRLAVEEKNIDQASALYRKLLPLLTMFEESGQYVQLNKAALGLLGRPVGAPRKPMLPVGGEMLEKLRSILTTIVPVAL